MDFSKESIHGYLRLYGGRLHHCPVRKDGVDSFNTTKGIMIPNNTLHLLPSVSHDISRLTQACCTIRSSSTESTKLLLFEDSYSLRASRSMISDPIIISYSYSISSLRRSSRLGIGVSSKANAYA
ncbi:hypothetical protein KSP40_PGU000907 [Platanthera guangdongensis]|uniref:Uncharacterized protein n=1 Tax=Platanthera guangdongensis TaxID=2320717 RepID=A0ABR2M3G3_9ASPA